MVAKTGLLPYEEVKPGFESQYTGESSAHSTAVGEIAEQEYTDDSGHVCFEWDLWALSGVRADWGPEIQHINGLQERLGPLSDDLRKVRQHISSIVQCDSGIPVTIDQVLDEIAAGRLHEQAFHAGCWMSPGIRSTQPGQPAAMQTIEDVLNGYLGGTPVDQALQQFPYARGIIQRAYQWLGPVDSLPQVRKLMMARMLLPFEFFTGRNDDHPEVEAICFGATGRGAELDREISAQAGLPPIFANYRKEYWENLSTIDDAEKKSMYAVCCAIAHGAHGLSDCHHSVFRWIERWICGIGTGQWSIPTRKENVERERLGNLLYGYVFALDKWLLTTPMQFLLLDLAHVDLGFDLKNEILRVYAYLGEERTPEKEWLSACLWYHLYNCLHHWDSHKSMLDVVGKTDTNAREWMDGQLPGSASQL
jgi:hypothetical protein